MSGNLVHTQSDSHSKGKSLTAYKIEQLPLPPACPAYISFTKQRITVSVLTQSQVSGIPIYIVLSNRVNTTAKVTDRKLVWPRVGLMVAKNAIKAHSPRYSKKMGRPVSVKAGAASIAIPLVSAWGADTYEK